MVRERFGSISVPGHWIKAGSVSGLLMGGAAVLLLFPPERYGFYPQCPFFEATGWLCPGCGATRALAALLRGDVAGAWKLNALIVSLLPLAAIFGVLRICRKDVRLAPSVWIGVGVLAAAFAIFRNLAA